MGFKRDLLSVFLVGGGSLFGFVLMAYLISIPGISEFDQVIISFIHSFESPTVTSIMNLFTIIGSFPSVSGIFLLSLFFLYFVLKYRTEFILFGSIVIGTTIINQLLKLLFQRTRPDINRLIEAGGYSFPSGHAMGAFALYGVLTFILWRHIHTRFGRTALIMISSVFILMIGISRIYLGVHYPSDIIGGYFASGFCLTIGIWIFQRYKERQFERKTA